MREKRSERGNSREEKRKNKKREATHNRREKALQLSGTIPAQGAGGAGSIPAKAPFLSKSRKDVLVYEGTERGSRSMSKNKKGETRQKGTEGFVVKW